MKLYAGENSGEATARRFSADPKRVRDWRKNQTELQRLSEEDSSRARLPAGGRKKFSEQPEINMQGWVISKQTHHERVSCKMIRAMDKQMRATMSDSRDEEFAVSDESFPPLQQLHLQKTYKYCPEGCQRINREAGEVCDIFILDF